MSIQHWLNIIEIFIYLWPSRHVIYMWYGYCMLLSNWKSKSYQIMSQAFFGMIWDGLACLSTIVMICDDPLYPHISPWYPHMSPWYPHDIPMISPWYPHDIPMISPWYPRCTTIQPFLLLKSKSPFLLVESPYWGIVYNWLHHMCQGQDMVYEYI